MQRLGQGGRWLGEVWVKDINALGDLFYFAHPSNSQLAAHAIERYIYEGADQPWA
jgi:hypothetical protein